MVCFNSLSFFFFSKINFKSDFGKTVVFTFFTGFNVWAGLVLVVVSWFGFLMVVSWFAVKFISFCTVPCVGFNSFVVSWFWFSCCTGFTGLLSRFGFVWFTSWFSSKFGLRFVSSFVLGAS